MPPGGSTIVEQHQRVTGRPAPGLPKKEGMPINPLSPYSVTKWAAEEYCQIFRKVYCLPAVSLRYFNIYGPRQNPDSEYSAAIPKFIKLKLQGKTIHIYGDAKATHRSWRRQARTAYPLIPYQQRTYNLR